MATFAEQQASYLRRIEEAKQAQEAFIPAAMEKVRGMYEPRIQKYRDQIASLEKLGVDTSLPEQMLAQTIKYYDRDLVKIDQQFEKFVNEQDALIARYESKLDAPRFKQNLQREQIAEKAQQAQVETARIAQQRQDEAERFRREREASVREEAERKASSFRARTGGSRAAARPMLSAARMSPEQTLSPMQTLGTFMPT